MNATVVAGIFVGGKSSRMGGRPKGLLHAPGSSEPIAARLARIAAECGLEVVLVGEARAYCEALPDLTALADAPAIEGPLAGLASLLRFAGERTAIALACDLPFVEANLLERLAAFPSDADVVAPRLAPDAPWEPLFARYQSARVLAVLERSIAEGTRSFQALFKRLRVDASPLQPHEARQLRDWDSPTDLLD